MEFLEAVEDIRAGEATISRIFNSNDGVSVRSIRKSPKYLSNLSEAAKLLGRVQSGFLPMHYLKEAMSTSDFPLLFGDILDRQVLAQYNEWPQTYRNYVDIATVRDFRTVNRFSVTGAEAVLSEIVPEMSEYPAVALGEERFQYRVKKYGRRIAFTWEDMVNDDLNSLRNMPARLGRAARRTEEKFATALFVQSTGPDSTLYSVGNNNIVPSNAVFSITGIQTALTKLSAQTDADGEPIVIDTVELVIPPALLVAAQNVMNATEIRTTINGGASSAEINAVNWMRSMFRINVNPYLPIIDTTHGATAWYLFANPSNGRPALQMGFLAGHESPEIFMKSSNSIRVGGGGLTDPMDGDFENDGIQHKLRHVLGGGQMDPKMTVASNGSGA